MKTNDETSAALSLARLEDNLRRDIAAKIIERKGHSCLVVKGNQENLYKELKAEFEKAMSLDRAPKHLSTHEVASKEIGLRSIGATTYRSDDPNGRGDGEVRRVFTSQALLAIEMRHLGRPS